MCFREVHRYVVPRGIREEEERRQWSGTRSRGRWRRMKRTGGGGGVAWNMNFISDTANQCDRRLHSLPGVSAGAEWALGKRVAGGGGGGG